MYSHRRPRVPVILILFAVLGLVLPLASCGGGDDASSESSGPTTYTKKDSETMKTAGTADTEEEKQRREQEAAQAAARAAARKEISKAFRDLSRAEDDWDIAEALGTVGELGELASHEAKRIKPYLKHEEPEVRAAAYKTLGLIQGEDSAGVLEVALKDDESAVRLAGLSAWRKIGLRRIAPVLPLLADFDSSVQHAAMQVIGARDDVDKLVIDEVVARMEDLDGAAARLALAFARKHKESILELEMKLVPLLQHQHPGVRTDTIKAIGSLGTKKYDVVKNLVLILGDDPDETVVKESHTLLAAWAGAGAPGFDPTLDVEDDKRKAAYRAWKSWLESNRARFP